MPYIAEISRTNPTCFLFLIDQSKSMAEKYLGEDVTKEVTKAAGVADAINRLLDALVDQCTNDDAILDRYYIGVVGYGLDVGPALGGELSKDVLAPVSKIADHPLRLEKRTRKQSDGAGGVYEDIIELPVWLEAKADGKTPMCQALELARQTVSDFVKRYQACFPPIVIHISDGVATDGDPTQASAVIRDVHSQDGNVLLFNMHTSAKNAREIVYPDQEQSLPNEEAKRLFRMSSPLTPQMLREAKNKGYQVSEGARGFAFNGGLESVVEFLDIGTRTGIVLREC